MPDFLTSLATPRHPQHSSKITAAIVLDSTCNIIEHRGSTVNMGVTKKVLKPGNGTDKPKKGDEVTIEYTGNLYDESQSSNDYRGKQ